MSIVTNVPDYLAGELGVETFDTGGTGGTGGTVDAFLDDFNLDDYILSDISDVWGDMAPQITSNAGYDQTDSKTFQAMSRALTDHKKATQGYTSSWIYGDRKIPLSEEAIKNKTFPGYEATEEGLQQLTDDLVNSFIGTMNAFPKAGAFESLSSDQKEFVLRYTKNANYETASGEQQNELFTNPRTEVGDAEKTITLPTESYGDLTVTSIPDMTYKSSDGFNQMYVDTDQGRFVFLTNDYLNKGFVEDSPFVENRKFQNYSRGLLNPETRSEILGSAVPVDLSDIEGSLSDYGVSTGNNVSLDKLTNTQGILIPVEQAEKLNNAYSALGGTTSEIKGFAMVNGKPTYIQDDSYNTTIQYSETGNGAFTDINDTRGIVTDTGVRYQKGGMFDNFSGIKVLDNALGGISDALAGVEDIGREGSEQLRSALQNEYVRAAIKVVASVSPDPLTKFVAATTDVILTHDDGDNPSASQYANMALSGAEAYQDTTGLGFDEGDLGSTIEDPSAFDEAIQAATNETVEKVVTSAGKIIDGEDEVKVLVGTFGQDIINGVADATDATLGTDAGDVIRNNPKASNVILEVGTGTSVAESVVNNYADDIADATGATTTNEIAGVKAALSTGVALDEGLEFDDALFEGAKTYYKEGGTIPGADVDVEVDGFSLSDLGIDLGGFPDFVGDINARFPTIPAVALSLFEGGLSIPEIEGLGIDISGVEFPEVDLGIDTDLSLGDVDLGIDGVDLGIDGVDLSLGDVDVDLPEVSIDLPEVETPEVELGDVDLGIDGPDLPEVDGPDISKPTLDLMQFAGLLGGLSTTGGAKAPTEEEQPGSQYQTQFDFLAGLQPLGMLGNFQRRS